MDHREKVRRTAKRTLACAVYAGFLAAVTEVSGENVNGPTPEQGVRLPELTVTEERIERDLVENPGLPSASLEISLSAIDAEMMSLQNTRSLAESLEYLPGAHTETRGRKLRQFVSFRGQIYPYPDYAVNGMWIGNFDEVLRFLPASQIQSVTVLRSSGALMLGLSDLSGIINVAPVRFTEETTLLETEAASHGHVRTSLTHGSTGDRGYYSLGLNHTQTQGPTGENAGEKVESVIGNAGVVVSDKLHLDGTCLLIQGRREWPVPNEPGPGYDERRSTPEVYDPFRQWFLGLRAVHEQSPSASTEVTASFSERTGRYASPYADNPDQRRGTDRDYEYTVNAMQALRLYDPNTLRIGALYSRWKTAKGSHFWWDAPSDLHTLSLVIVDEHRFDRLVLDAGIRYTRTYNRERSGRGFTVGGAIKQQSGVRDEWSDPLVSAALGAVYEASRTTSVYAHVAAGTAGPEPGRETVDGSELTHELRIMGDAGIKVRTDGRGTLKLGGFCVFRNDAAVFDRQERVSGQWTAYYENSDVAQYGLELEARSAPIRGVSTVYFNAAVMESRRKQASGGSGELRQIPECVVNGGVYSRCGAFDCNVFARYVSGYENNRFNENGEYQDLGDYVDVNVTLGYTFGPAESTRVYVAIRNLLDERYSTVDGWRSYGTEYTVGLRHRF